ncbi:MAG TPA: NAD(+) synthase [Candidatus Dorea intestinavium]|nr:NAD(+) synthase [Candidatus Dorea intestinavium]
MNIRIACAQFTIIPGRPNLNYNSIINIIADAKKQNIDLLIFPELCLSGYLLGDLWEQTSFLEDCVTYGKKIIAASTDICIVFGNVALDYTKVNEDGRPRKYNAAFIAQNGQKLTPSLKHPTFKSALPNYREFDDSRYFHSLNKFQRESNSSLKSLIKPVFLTIRDTSLNIGVMLCEDAWTEDYFINIPALLAKNGADILLNLSCSPFTLGKNKKRHQVFAKLAQTYNLPLIYCNNIGVQNNGKNIFAFDGATCAYQKNGDLLTEAEPYKEKILTIEYSFNTKDLIANKSLVIPPQEIASIYQGLVYGVTNFLQQTNIKKMVVAVSGGIDSAVAAAIYTKILGKENVLLVNIPTKNNSSLTQKLACSLATKLGCPYLVIPIQDSLDLLCNNLETTPVVPLSNGDSFKIELSTLTLENIQARQRMQIIATLAASFGGAFSCNSNKTELTIGYSTFYGDLTGIVALLGDLWKYQVYDLAYYLNNSIYQKEIIPQEMFLIRPSAELSPAQTIGTGGDPLHYPYHDFLLKALVESWNKISPYEILLWYKENMLEQKIGCEQGLVKKLFPTAVEFITDLERWWSLFAGFAIAKRIQAPPIFSISKRSFGYDFREAQIPAYYSLEYKRLKTQLLKK